MSDNNNSDLLASRERIILMELRYGLAKTVVERVIWLGIAICGVFALRELAGKFTYADVNFSAFLNQQCAEVSLGKFYLLLIFSWIVAILGILYGRRESKLRKDVVARLTEQITSLQLLIDARRTSSMLTQRGDTAERDKR